MTKGQLQPGTHDGRSTTLTDVLTDTPGEGHAVVIGAGIGGLCAARALLSRFAKVTVLESDSLPKSPDGRRGTPQAWHNHLLLEAGRTAVESLFDGFTDRLIANGVA
jgi:FAD dependent oxidoreductase